MAKTVIDIPGLAHAWEKIKQLVSTSITSHSNSSSAHSVATTSAPGFQSKEDKVKLDGIADGANKTVVDANLSSSSANPVQNKTVTQEFNKFKPITTAGTGAAYTASVPGITELTAGIFLIIKPHTVSTTTTPTLNLNDLGAKTIRRRISLGTSTTVVGSSNSWLGADLPVIVVFDGTYWIADSLPKTAAADIYGAVPIANGGTGATTAATAITALLSGQVVVPMDNSELIGTTLPAAGNAGRIFLKRVT